MTDIPELSGPNAEANKDPSHTHVHVSPIKSDKEVVGGVVLGTIDQLNINSAQYNEMIDAGVAAAIKFKPIVIKPPAVLNPTSQLRKDVMLNATPYLTARGTIARSLGPLLSRQDPSIKTAADRRAAVTSLILERTLNSRFQSVTDIQTEQLATSKNILKFQTTIGTKYMRQTLALNYRQLYATNHLVTLTKAFADMVENKLEAIKINTKLPDIVKPVGILKRIRTAAVNTAVNQAGAAIVSKAKDFAVNKVAPAVADYFSNDHRPDLGIKEKAAAAASYATDAVRKTKFGNAVYEGVKSAKDSFRERGNIASIWPTRTKPDVRDALFTAVKTGAASFAERNNLRETLNPDTLWDKSSSQRNIIVKLLRSIAGQNAPKPQDGPATDPIHKQETAAATEGSRAPPMEETEHKRTGKDKCCERITAQLEKIYKLLDERLSAPVRENGFDDHNEREREQFGPDAAGASRRTGGGGFRFGLPRWGWGKDKPKTSPDQKDSPNQNQKEPQDNNKDSGGGIGDYIKGAIGGVLGGNIKKVVSTGVGIAKAGVRYGTRAVNAIRGIGSATTVGVGEAAGAAAGAGILANVAIGTALVGGIYLADRARSKTDALIDAATGNKGIFLKARMKTYGVTSSQQLAVASLELRVIKILNSASESRLHPEELQEFAKLFGFDPKNAAAMDYFKTWVTGRFITTLKIFRDILQDHKYQLGDESKILPSDVTMILDEFNKFSSILIATYKNQVPTPEAFLSASNISSVDTSKRVEAVTALTAIQHANSVNPIPSDTNPPAANPQAAAASLTGSTTVSPVTYTAPQSPANDYTPSKTQSSPGYNSVPSPRMDSAPHADYRNVPVPASPRGGHYSAMPAANRAAHTATISNLHFDSGLKAPGSPATTSSNDNGSSSPTLIGMVKKLEGKFTAKPFWDYKQWTSGYGTKASGPNEIITPEIAEQRLNDELSKSATRIDAAAKKSGITLTANQRDALTSFDYNTGRGSSVISQAQGDATKIPGLLSQFTHAGGNELPGLVDRRKQEIAMFNSASGTTVTSAASSPQAAAASMGAANENKAGAPGYPGVMTASAQQPGASGTLGGGAACLPSGTIGSGQCVDLVKSAAGIGHTSSWSAGQSVVGNPNLKPGTAIATFDQSGAYGNHTDGSSHAAIYLGPSTKFPGGIRVYDQWSGQPAHERDIRPNSKLACDSANDYKIVTTPENKDGAVAKAFQGDTAGTAVASAAPGAAPADNTTATSATMTGSGDSPSAAGPTTEIADTSASSSPSITPPPSANTSISAGPSAATSTPSANIASSNAGPSQNVMAPTRSAVASAQTQRQPIPASPVPSQTTPAATSSTHPDLVASSRSTADLMQKMVSMSGNIHETLKDLHKTTQDAYGDKGVFAEMNNQSKATPTVIAPTINNLNNHTSDNNGSDDGLDVSKKREPRYAA